MKGIIHSLSCSQKTILAATTSGVHELVPLETQQSHSSAPKLAMRCVGKIPTVVQSLCLHETRPLYAIGGTTGEVALYQTASHGRAALGDLAPLSPLELAKPLRFLRKGAGGHHRVNTVRFNHSGNLLGTVDRSGHFSLWHVETSTYSLNAAAATTDTNIYSPYVQHLVHSKQAGDFAFLNDAGLTVTVGLHKAGSEPGANVALWDWTLPPLKAAVLSFRRQDVLADGGGSVAVCPQRHWVVVGGRKGTMCIFDLRNTSSAYSVLAHESNIRATLAHHSERLLVTGSSDGHVAAFDAPSLQPVGVWLDVHSRSTFVSAPNSSGIFQSAISTIGTTDLSFYDSDWILSCGSDGRIDAKRLQLSLS